MPTCATAHLRYVVTSTSSNVPAGCHTNRKVQRYNALLWSRKHRHQHHSLALPKGRSCVTAWAQMAESYRPVAQYFVGETYSTQPLNVTRDKLFVNYHAADASSITYQLVFGAGSASGAPVCGSLLTAKMTKTTKLKKELL